MPKINVIAMAPLKTICLFIILPCVVSAQSGGDSLIISRLPVITYDYKKCKVNIKTGNWEKHYKTDALPVNVTIKNTSADTLKYGLWTTCWLNYTVDNKDLEREGQWDDITHNFVEIYILPPQTNKEAKIYLVKRAGLKCFHGKFKIGFRLVLERGFEISNDLILNKDGSFTHLPDSDIKKRSHVIWSNTIKM